MRALLLIGLLLSVPCWAGTPLPDAPHVVTSGEGKITAKPDLARVTITAQYQNANGATAKQSVDRSIDAFLKIAPDFGLTPDDITASDVSVSEDINYDSRDRRVSNGFVASREVKLKLRDLERLGALLDAALAAGLTEIGNVSFESSREDQLRWKPGARPSPMPARRLLVWQPRSVARLARSTASIAFAQVSATAMAP